MTLTHVARVLVERGLSLAHATSGALVLLTDDRRALRLVYAGRAPAEQPLPLTARDPLADVMRTHQELWLVADAGQLAERFPDAAPWPGAASWAVLPLHIGGIMLGAVSWSFSKPAFDAKQQAGLRALARAGGAALYHAGLYESERRARLTAQAAEAEAVRRDAVMANVSATLDAVADAANATVLASIARLVLPLLGTWCAVHLVDARGRLHQVASGYLNTASEQQLLNGGNRRQSGRGRKLSPALRGGSAAVIGDLADRQARRTGMGVPELRALRGQGFQRLMVLPLHIHGHTLGTWCVASNDPTGTYSAADLELAYRAARRCAASLEYARLREVADRANHAHDDFVAATSHELRTPLSHIKGFVSSLRTTDPEWDSDTCDDFLAEIDHEADRLTDLVDTLLDMSRIDSGGLNPAERAATAPVALVSAGVARVRMSLDEHPLAIDMPDTLPLVLVDASQVERVIANLLDNATKYSPPTETIDVMGRLTGNSVTFRIEDRGLGIPAEHLERIFEPFFREPTTTYPSKPGTGLGLAICRSIVRAQHGRIWAEQRAGGGAAFVFTLPVAAGSQ